MAARPQRCAQTRALCGCSLKLPYLQHGSFKTTPVDHGTEKANHEEAYDPQKCVGVTQDDESAPSEQYDDPEQDEIDFIFHSPPARTSSDRPNGECSRQYDDGNGEDRDESLQRFRYGDCNVPQI